MVGLSPLKQFRKFFFISFMRKLVSNHILINSCYGIFLCGLIPGGGIGCCNVGQFQCVLREGEGSVMMMNRDRISTCPQ